jgi:hypothetical protein
LWLAGPAYGRPSDLRAPDSSSSRSRGQTFIEAIRFAAANRLLVNLDYRDQQGKRSTRTIEAYSLRRSRAGDVLLMAVRAEDGQPRS